MDKGLYTEPSKITTGGWLDIWLEEYTNDIKPNTKARYGDVIRVHLKPNLGAATLQQLKTPAIQKLYNDLQRRGMSPKTIRDIHGVLHSALKQAVKLSYIRSNPSESCSLPRREKREMQVLTDEKLTAFFAAIKGHPDEHVLFTAIFTGMRMGELLGLTWDCVDFDNGTITIAKQLYQSRGESVGCYLDTPKNGKSRMMSPAVSVMDTLRARRAKQAEDRLRAGEAWDNPMNLVFTNELGRYNSRNTLRRHFNDIVAKIGAEGVRFHDLRHSYAVLSISNGDDIKTVQENLGHHTAAFTLDTYAHVTERMREDSGKRMDALIRSMQ
ncbi:site-specific integrase [Eubacteriales bacterium OttesenSCG-928-M02]|nr:site-specific integrase [Eubacteriales bacterium OttesenSCG-928-M02]